MRFPFYALTTLCLFGLVACSSSPLKMPTENERFSQMYLESATELLYQEKFHQALSALLDAIRYNPKSQQAWNNIGLAYYGLRETSKAQDAWNKALALNPNFSEARSNLGAMLLEQNKLAEAEQQFHVVLKDLVYTKSYLAHYNLALIYLRQGKQILAEQHFSSAVQSNHFYCSAWLQLGYLAKNKGDLPLAADRFRGATMGTCYNGSAEAHYQLGQTFIDMGNKSAARTKFIELIQNFGQNQWAVKAKGALSMLLPENP